VARSPSNPNAPYYVQLRDFKRRLIEGALEVSDGKAVLAAQRLGLPKATWKKLCRELDIKGTYAPYAERTAAGMRTKAAKAALEQAATVDAPAATDADTPDPGIAEAVEGFEEDGLFLMADEPDEEEEDTEELDEDEDEDEDDEDELDEDDGDEDEDEDDADDDAEADTDPN